jgi:20S proteasome alpha/beta subunit
MNNWKTPNTFGTYSDSNILPQRKENMTYILGADCSDGVVLVGDTRVTVITDHDYIFSSKFDRPLNNKKIRHPLDTVIMGSSGIGDLYEEFKGKMLARIIKEERNWLSTNILHKSAYLTEEEFRDLASDVIKEINIGYGKDSGIMNGFFILSASRIDESKAYLTYFTQVGAPHPVKAKYAQIGSGTYFADTFIKGLWTPEWTMEQTAKLGIFIIKYITDSKLDAGVGYSNEMLPQVICLPHDKNSPVKELQTEEVQNLIKEANTTISDFKEFLNKKFH